MSDTTVEVVVMLCLERIVSNVDISGFALVAANPTKAVTLRVVHCLNQRHRHTDLALVGQRVRYIRADLGKSLTKI